MHADDFRWQELIDLSASRREFLRACRSAAAVVAIGGTGPRGARGSPSPLPLRLERALPHNPHIHFYNGRRGYVRCDVSRDHHAASFRVVPWITQPGAPLETRARFVVDAGRAGASATS
jgi:phosphodiesterase/alkaline phosphatase D-like protein